jgi:hypothetical protein
MYAVSLHSVGCTVGDCGILWDSSLLINGDTEQH